jgi:hypothetical protein
VRVAGRVVMGEVFLRCHPWSARSLIARSLAIGNAVTEHTTARRRGPDETEAE